MNKPILAYLSYPYTKDPEAYTEKVRKLAKKLQSKYENLVLVIPHFASNFMKEGESTEEHGQAIFYDLAFIQRCDIFIVGKDLDYQESVGCVWEYYYAKILGKLIYDAKEMLRKTVKLKVD